MRRNSAGSSSNAICSSPSTMTESSESVVSPLLQLSGVLVCRNTGDRRHGEQKRGEPNALVWTWTVGRNTHALLLFGSVGWTVPRKGHALGMQLVFPRLLRVIPYNGHGPGTQALRLPGWAAQPMRLLVTTDWPSEAWRLVERCGPGASINGRSWTDSTAAYRCTSNAPTSHVESSSCGRRGYFTGISHA